MGTAPGKVRPPIYWTNKNTYFDEIGIVVIGKVRLPVAFLLAFYGGMTVICFILGGIVAGVTGGDQWMLNIAGGVLVAPVALLIPAGIYILVVWAIRAVKKANAEDGKPIPSKYGSY